GGVRAPVHCLPRHHQAEPFVESAPIPPLASTAPARPGDHTERHRPTRRFCGLARKCWRHAREHTARKKPDYRLTAASPGPNRNQDGYRLCASRRKNAPRRARLPAKSLREIRTRQFVCPYGPPPPPPPAL